MSAGETPKPAAKIRVVEELLARRAYLCRLTPDRALESSVEAFEFLGDRGMLTRTPGSALPSLFEACHEEPYAPGSRGFGSWPATNRILGCRRRTALRDMPRTSSGAPSPASV